MACRWPLEKIVSKDKELLKRYQALLIENGALKEEREC